MEPHTGFEAKALYILNTGNFMLQPLYHRTAGTGLFPEIIWAVKLVLMTRGGHCFQKVLGFTTIK
jgi:hypothetical protein